MVEVGVRVKMRKAMRLAVRHSYERANPMLRDVQLFAVYKGFGTGCIEHRLLSAWRWVDWEKSIDNAWAWICHYRAGCLGVQSTALSS
jgi:hypothetical protein